MAGDGTVRHANNLANVGDIHRLQRLSLGVANVVVRIALRHEKVAPPPFQFTHTATRQTANLLPLLVIDVIPVFRLLDVGNLPLCLNGRFI